MLQTAIPITASSPISRSGESHAATSPAAERVSDSAASPLDRLQPNPKRCRVRSLAEV
jgi:hypothetical protein